MFFDARTGGDDPRIYGWAVLDRSEPEAHRLYFVPAAPTNYLKMTPWWDKEAEKLTDRIRGTVKQGSLWHVSGADTKALCAGIRCWLAGGDQSLRSDHPGYSCERTHWVLITGVEPLKCASQDSTSNQSHQTTFRMAP